MIRNITYLFLLLNFNLLLAKDYYVNPVRGNDGNNGISANSAFKSLSRIQGINLQPGDTVFLMNGVYENPGNTLLVIDESGTADNWITIRNYPGHSPLLKFDSWTGIDLINGASYIAFNGLRIQGARTKITLEEALNQPGSCANDKIGGPQGLYNGTGILVVGPNLRWSNGATRGNEIPHHILVENCEIFDCTSSGIACQQADYITIRNSKIYNNAWYTLYGTSGINFYQFVNTDGSTGIHNEVYNNLMYGNELKVPQLPSCRFFDGNAFIVDDFNHNQTGNYLDPNNGFEAYTAKTIIKNNVVVENGGSGLHFFLSSNCLIYNNTVVNNAFQNNGSNGNGDLRIGRCSDFEIKNNIFKGEIKVNAVSRNTNIEYTNNYHEGPRIIEEFRNCESCINEGIVFDNMDITNPSPFISSSENVLKSKGVIITEVVDDYLGYTRTTTDGIDIGAYELGNCGVVTWYIDNDGDGIGSSTDTIEDCDQPAGYVSVSGDNCDDNPDSVEPTIWYADVDGDNLGNPEDTIEACQQPEGYVGQAGDTCDNDPNSTEGSIWYADNDSDGNGNPQDKVVSCLQPDGYIAIAGDDCDNDTNKTAPGDCGCGVAEGSCEVVIIPPSDNCSAPTFSINQVYDINDTVVTYQGKAYTNLWYTTGKLPTSGEPWVLVDVCDGSAEDCSVLTAWNPSTQYPNAGTKVKYQGKVFANKWYSSNDTPGASQVWELVNICDATSSKSSTKDNYLIKVYPTLVSENLTIETPSFSNIKVYNISGQFVKSIPVTKGINTINLGFLNTGYYFLSIQSDQFSVTKRIIKE